MSATCSEGSRFVELLPERALGTLAGDEFRELDAHLARCASCRAELAQLEPTLDALAVSAPPIEPPESLRDDLIAAIVADAGSVDATAIALERSVAEASAARARSLRRSRRWRVRLGFVAIPAFATAFVMLAVVAAVDVRRIQRLESKLDRFRSERTLAVLKGADVATVKTSGAFEKASAQVAVRGDAGIVALRNVPPPPAGMAWQVWQVDDRHHIESIGTLRRSARVAFLQIPPDHDVEIERVIITAEPAGGSEAPGRERVASGHLA